MDWGRGRLAVRERAAQADRDGGRGFAGLGRELRDESRELMGDRFIEVFVKASVDTCAERDVKGLYARALAGQITQFTGVSDPYEPPLAPEVALDTDREPVDASVEQVLACLERLGLTTAARPDRNPAR